MNEYTYKTLNSSLLSSEMKANGRVAVNMSNKRIRLAVKLIQIVGKVTGKDDKDYSLFQSFILLIHYLGLLSRIVLFHRRLFQLFIYFFYNYPNYIVEEKEDGNSVIIFVSESK